MKVITVANQKGGVGKTTTAVTLAHGLGLKGYQTLLLDLDPQGQRALALGLLQEPVCWPKMNIRSLVSQER